MKKLNKLIHLKMLEIAFALALIIISYPLWNKLKINEYTATAAFYNEAQYAYLSVLDNQSGSMFPISNENALKNLIPTKLSVHNETKTKEEFTLILKIDKISTLDYKTLNVALNKHIYSLKDLLIVENQDSYYFALNTDSIQAETKEIEFLMWMKQETGNDMQGKTLSYSFELQKGIKI